MTAIVEGNELVIRVPLNNPPCLSKQGKSYVIASSYGNKPTELEVQGKKVIVGLNAYIPVK